MSDKTTSSRGERWGIKLAHGTKWGIRSVKKLDRYCIEKAKEKTLYTILCKCLFSEVAVQAVTELDNKATHCHAPVPQWHRPFSRGRLDCQPYHLFH